MNKYLILDRDGVINVDYGYVYKPTDLTYVDGIFDLITHFSGKGYRIWIATNQSGIGRGYYSKTDFHKCMQIICNDIFKVSGTTIDGYSFCPHFTPSDGNCDCRKPLTGMIDHANINIDPRSSIMIGDKLTDYDFSQNLGLSVHYNVGKPLLEFKNGNIATSLVNVKTLQDVISHLNKLFI